MNHIYLIMKHQEDIHQNTSIYPLFMGQEKVWLRHGPVDLVDEKYYTTLNIKKISFGFTCLHSCVFCLYMKKIAYEEIVTKKIIRLFIFLSTPFVTQRPVIYHHDWTSKTLSMFELEIFFWITSWMKNPRVICILRILMYKFLKIKYYNLHEASTTL